MTQYKKYIIKNIILRDKKIILLKGNENTKHKQILNIRIKYKKRKNRQRLNEWRIDQSI